MLSLSRYPLHPGVQSSRWSRVVMCASSALASASAITLTTLLVLMCLCPMVAQAQTATPTPAPTPAAPTLSGTPGATQNTLNWNTVSNALSYNVYRGVAVGGPYSTLATNLTTPTYTDSGLTNRTYDYVVRTNGANSTQSVLSNEVALSTGTTLFTPRQFHALSGAERVTLTWDQQPLAASYNVYRSTNSAGPFAKIKNTTGLIYVHTGLTDGTTYYYRLTAVDSAGNESSAATASAAAIAAVPGPTLAAPTGLTGTAGDQAASIDWYAAPQAARYNVKVSTSSSGPYTLTKTTSDLEADFHSLTNGTTYYYVISSLGADGTESSNSAPVAVTPQAPPAAPSSLSCSATTGNVNIIWTASPTATSYVIKRSTTTGGPYSLLVSGVTTLAYNDTTVSNGTHYYYVVQGTNSSGTGSASYEVDVTPLAVPTNLAAVASTSSLSVSWSAVTNATNYKIYRSTTAGVYTSAFSTTLSASTLSYNSTGLSPNTHYYFKVVALGSNSTSNDSVELNAATLPSAVSGLSGTAGNAQVVLNWSAVSGATTGVTYGVRRATSVNGTYTTLTSTLSALNYTNTGLTNGTTYYYRVYAINAGGNGADSATLSLTPQAPDTTSPLVMITQPGEGQILTNLSSVSGTASDVGTGVARVDVRLSRVVNSQTEYWNGSTWSTTSAVLPTSTEVSWIRNTSLPSGSNLPLGAYTLTAQAFDGANNASTLVTRHFSVVLSLDARIAAGADSTGAPLPSTAYVGQGIINTDATKQSVSAQGGAGAPLFFSVRVHKDGNSDDIKLTGPALTNGWSVLYLDPNGIDITSAITGTGWTYSMSNGDELLMGVVITPPSNAAVGDSRSVMIHASCSDQEDVVKATAQVIALPQLDASIKQSPTEDDPSLGATFTGEQVVNKDATNQHLSINGIPNSVTHLELKVQNNWASATPFAINLPTVPTGWSVKLYDALTGGQEVTTQALTNAGWTAPSLATGASVSYDLAVQAPSGVTANLTSLPVHVVTAASAGMSTQVLDALSVDVGLQGIGGIEYSRDFGATWTPVPNDVPLEAQQYDVIAFRAIRANTNLDWPDGPTFAPQWTQGDQSPIGETVYLHFPTVSAQGTTQTVSVACGNSLCVQVHVGPIN